MADILEILDKGQILTDIDAVITGITKLEEKITEASNKVLSIKVDLQGAESLEALTAATKQYQQAAQDLGVVQKQNLELEKQRITLSEQYGATITENAETLAYLKLDLQRTEQAIRALNYAIKEGKGNQEALTQRLIEQTEQQVVLRQAINTTTAAMRQQTDIGLDKQAKKDAIATQKHAESQIGLYNSLSAVRKEMIKLEMSGQKMSAEYAALAVRAKQLSQAQIEVNNATKGSLSIFTRFGDMFERMGIRIIASLVWWSAIGAAITAVYEWMTKLSDSEEIAKNRLDALTDSVKNLSQTLDSMDFDKKTKQTQDLFKAERLTDYINGVKSIKNQLEGAYKAYQDISSLAPGVLDQFKDKGEFEKNFRSDKMKKQLDDAKEYIKLSDDINIHEKTLNETIATRDKFAGEIRENRAENKRLTGDASFSTGGYIAKAKYVADLKANEDNYKQLEENFKMYSRTIILEQSKLADKERDLLNKYGKTKDGKPKKDNAKGLEAALALEKQLYEQKLKINQAEFDASRRTYTDSENQRAKDLVAAEKHGGKMVDIIIKWHGQVGEDENKYHSRILQAQNDLLNIQNATNEAELKQAKEIQAKHEKVNEELDKEIAKLVELRDKLIELQATDKAIKAEGAAHSQYAEGGMPFLEALGYSGTFEEIGSKNREIEAKKAEIERKRQEQIAYNATPGANEVGSNKITNEIQEQQNQLDQLLVDRDKIRDDKIIKGKKEFTEKSIELAQKAYDAIREIQDNQFAHEERQLEIQKEALSIRNQQQIEAINATTNFAITKDNLLAAQAARTAARQNELQAESNALALRKAEFDKQAAEQKIEMDTAVGVMKIWAEYADLPILAAALSAVVVGIGAAEYNAVASQPLPQFEDGGVTSTSHFIAAEGNKPELIIAPSGDVSIASKEGVYTAPIGSTVKNASDTEKLLKYAINGIGINGMSMGMLMEQRTKQMTDKRIVEELQDLNQSLVNTLYATRTQPAKNDLKNTVDRLYNTKMFRK